MKKHNTKKMKEGICFQIPISRSDEAGEKQLGAVIEINTFFKRGMSKDEKESLDAYIENVVAMFSKCVGVGNFIEQEKGKQSKIVLPN